MKIRKLCIVLLTGVLMVLAGTSVFASKIDYADKEVIMQVQTLLNEQGFDTGTPDGVSGQKTKQAIRDYRSAESLTEGDRIDAELFNSLVLDEKGKRFVRAVQDAAENFLDTGETIEEVTLHQFDLCISVSPGTENVSDEEALSAAAAELSAVLSSEVLKMEEYDYLWDTITLCYGSLPGIVSKKDDGAGVTPGVKAALNSYETFVSEYADFLAAYDETDFTQQTQYLSLMRKYAEYTGEIEALKETELTEADQKYYESVMARVEKRLPED